MSIVGALFAIGMAGITAQNRSVPATVIAALAFVVCVWSAWGEWHRGSRVVVDASRREVSVETRSFWNRRVWRAKKWRAIPLEAVRGFSVEHHVVYTKRTRRTLHLVFLDFGIPDPRDPYSPGRVLLFSSFQKDLAAATHLQWGDWLEAATSTAA